VAACAGDPISQHAGPGAPRRTGTETLGQGAVGSFVTLRVDGIPYLWGTTMGEDPKEEGL